ncbi:hypothetical protein DB88DRAFT_484105 [Papiliotrema laurentii]|uniref:Assembly factor cbp4 n=1 Tax=Papiliotrema laurentii TaxID=5418 RepID=A0AAD9FSR1_PAPLA|nr:hypothetical protein DB88DRAFT_484105 [Papiliotrema laurentii]
MAQPGQVLWGKFFMMMGAITLGGWGLMRIVSPTDEQLYKKLAPDLKAKVDAARAKRLASEDIREKLQDASKGETDQIVWGDSFASKPPPGGRRV